MVDGRADVDVVSGATVLDDKGNETAELDLATLSP